MGNWVTCTTSLSLRAGAMAPETTLNGELAAGVAGTKSPARIAAVPVKAKTAPARAWRGLHARRWVNQARGA